mmetsp:Transcript_14612/g.24848  ORF Transcript_14612/g.24848 Transcript_14612/m.24848 type:complete len:118 (+) Transcript_14612:805-1158(+)
MQREGFPRQIGQVPEELGRCPSRQKLLFETAPSHLLEKNKTLTELSLDSTKITLSTSIQRSLVLNDKLLHIDLSRNRLGVSGAEYIAKHLKKNPPLSTLSLRGCGLQVRAPKVWEML